MVREVIARLKAGGRSRFNPPELLKCATNSISSALHSLFLMVWSEGKVPAAWGPSSLQLCTRGRVPRWTGLRELPVNHTEHIVSAWEGFCTRSSCSHQALAVRKPPIATVGIHDRTLHCLRCSHLMISRYLPRFAENLGTHWTCLHWLEGRLRL